MKCQALRNANMRNLEMPAFLRRRHSRIPLLSTTSGKRHAVIMHSASHLSTNGIAHGRANVHMTQMAKNGASQLSTRISLSRPVHFVCADDDLWPELASWNGKKALPPAVLARRTVGTRDCWIIRTYYELRLRGAGVTISATPHSGSMNVLDVHCLGRKQRLHLHFLVMARADGHPSKLANFVILQNDCVTDLGRVPTASIPHWAQPGIVRRLENRGETIKVLAFKGAPQNLDARFRSEGFKDALNALGVTLRTSSTIEGQQGTDWADYSDCDLILAARNLTEYDAANKPASKLVNAWFGEVPAMLGPEPAFLALKRSELDFFVVRTPDDVLLIIQRLKQEPELYTSVVANARQRRLDFTDDMIAQRWAEVLNGPATAAFDAWQRSSRLKNAAFVLRGFRGEAAAKRRHRHMFLNGKRILDMNAEQAG